MSRFAPDSLRALCAPLLERCTFAPAESAPSLDALSPVLHCAASGGADSTALAVLATTFGAEAAEDVAVVLHHVDHGLRPGSAAEAHVVATLAERLGVEFVAHQVDVEDGPNLEERCRQARFETLPPDVCTGHTSDDQAETILANLMRGAGARGLSALRPSPRHPIAALRRSETTALCASLGIDPVVDPMNTDDRFVRVRVRHELLPLLDDIAGRDVTGLLHRQATILGDEADFLDSLAAELDPTDARGLAAAPAVLAFRSLQQWITQTWRDNDGPLGSNRPPDHAAIQRCMQVARGEAVATDVGRGWRLVRSAQILSLQPPSAGASVR